jgi:cell division protein FtsQ
MKRSRKFILGFGVLLTAAAGTVILANIWKANLVVEEVTVSGNSIIEPQEILELVQVHSGSAMYDLDLLVIEQRVLGHPYVQHVVVERNLPSTIHVSIMERQPLAILTGRTLRYVDRDGIVFLNPISRDLFDLPVITGLPASAPIRPGTTIADADLAEALHILETSKRVGGGLYYLISEIRVRNGGDLLLYTTDGGVPVIFGRGHAARKLVAFETFWSTTVAERGSQALQYVDLRFDNQVVARWKRKT